MLPIIPALVLAFVSFICSVFVILRIVVPILPPHPLSKRVSPVCAFLSMGFYWLISSIVGRIWTSYLPGTLTCGQVPSMACEP